MPDLTNPTNTSKSTPNIPVSSATLHIGSSTFIAAPSSQVWSALSDTSTWPSWNSFVPRVTIRSQPDTLPPPPDSSTKADSPSLSPILKNGTRMTFHVNMDPSTNQPSTKEVHLVVTHFTAPNPSTRSPGRIVWASDFDEPHTMAPSLLTAERVHEVVDVDVTEDGEVLRGTEVRNWEAQVGWLAHVVKWMYGGKLQRNFELWVDGLKQFVERQSEVS